MFNLSQWALNNRQIVLYLILISALAGVFSYTRLGQSEDPPFTFKVMVIKTLWPGASADEVARLVTDRVEKKVMETGTYDYVKSYSRPGESVVIIRALDSMRSDSVSDLWYLLRKKVGDIRQTFPAGVYGPYFNDEFGTTFGNIYALSGKGFDYAVLKQYADRLQLELQRVQDVGKVDLIGVQDEKIWIELSNIKAATLGISLAQVQQALAQQNSVAAAGNFDTPLDRIYLHVSGRFKSVEQIRNFTLRIDDRSFRLGDIAKVWRGFSDPPAPRMRFMGKDAIGVAVSMKDGGDILALGKALRAEVGRLQDTLPVGMELNVVSDQPAVVKAGVGEFLQVLEEALIIVLLVSFFSLGLRSGLVVALVIPLVLAITFTTMNYFNIGLHKISLGALVLALGLLVDDAIIAVEMIAIKMEQGFSRGKAASYAWTSTAFPMLTGTLITASGFLPIATARSGTGEYTLSIFQVVAIALLVSWIAAVMFVPYLSYRLLPDIAGQEAHDPYTSFSYRKIRAVVNWCVAHRWLVIIVTLGIFASSVFLFKLVPQQFFPPSERLELIVDLKLSEGASPQATDLQISRLEQKLKEQTGIESYVAYIGSGSPRFYLPLDQQLASPGFGQIVVLCKTIEDRERIRRWLIETMNQDFSSLIGRVSRLENGPPVGYPVQFRISGEHADVVRNLAHEVADKVRENPYVSNVHLDWEEPIKMIYLNIDQERARALGVSSENLSNFLQGSISGAPVDEFREKDDLIEIRLRGTAEERRRLDLLPSLAVPTHNGDSVSLSQIATIRYDFEEGVVWHRDRLPTITVMADIYGDQQPASVIKQISPQLDTIRAKLPSGYLLEVGGTVESSTRSQQSVLIGMPLFLLAVMTLLMLQLKNIAKSIMVILTAPLGFIGVTLFLLLFHQPFGFVAMLGTIALSGMIMRNSVILVDQIDQDVRGGADRWHAIVDSTIRRFRPIVLTAMAAVLAMIPLSRSVFFGPMAVAIMGGLIVATALTLLFLPALYAAWFRVEAASPIIGEGNLSQDSLDLL